MNQKKTNGNVPARCINRNRSADLPDLYPCIVIFIAMSLLWLVTTGCDDVFKPNAENDKYYYSINGYLDASADTQWVRIMPIRESLGLQKPEPMDATVTLEHLETGETAEMNDSLFSYAHGTYAWNYWTTMNLVPEQTYRITVRRPDGNSSHATASLPPDFPAPVVRLLTNADGKVYRTNVRIAGVERLVDAQAIYHLRFFNTGEEDIVTFSHLKDAGRGIYLEVSFDPSGDESTVDDLIASSGPGRIGEVTHKQFFLASAGPDYPDFVSLNELRVSHLIGRTNVVNGTGYLAGILSKTVPYKSCTSVGMRFVPCEPEPPPW